MCLITTQKRAKIAKEDMTVWKELTPYRESIYFEFAYTPGKLYQTELKIMRGISTEPFDDVVIEYLDEKFNGWRKNKHSELASISEGFHSLLSEHRIGTCDPIFRCTIPAGSKYYLDATGLCVSNKIIIH